MREWPNIDQAAEDLKEKLVVDLKSIKQNYVNDIDMAVDFYLRCVAL